MLDEENDKIIREAADQYHPAYDDTAWDKMEKMLDENLPQEKGRKKIFFLLPFLLLLGGLIFFMVSDNRQKHSSAISNISVQKKLPEKSNTTNPSTANSSEQSINIPLNGSSTSEKNKGGFQKTRGNSGDIITDKPNQVPVSSIKDYRNGQHNYKENLSGKFKILSKQGSIAEENDDNKIIKSEPDSFTAMGNKSLNNNNNISEGAENKTDTPEPKNQAAAVNRPEIRIQDTLAKIANTQSGIARKETKNKNGFQNNFGITLSAGSDISGVYINNAGKLTIVYGAGLSYSISKRFAVRSGFYVSKKIYSVGPDDYHLPPGGSGSYDYLKNIDANCTVFEIPVNIDYNFGKVKNHSWFVSTGLSTYLMKRESYDYYYKTPTGNAYNKEWTINNKNKNFFSVLNLSGGYQYFFNKQLSIMAEPYINLPLSGIGEGKVKLNSGGILFTLTVKPFLKNGK